MPIPEFQHDPEALQHEVIGNAQDLLAEWPYEKFHRVHYMDRPDDEIVNNGLARILKGQLYFRRRLIEIGDGLSGIEIRELSRRRYASTVLESLSLTGSSLVGHTARTKTDWHLDLVKDKVEADVHREINDLLINPNSVTFDAYLKLVRVMSESRSQ